MTNRPKISIITINFNNRLGLIKTVESVINQTYRDFEYIVIDGGSTDGSKAYLEIQQAHFDYWVSEPDEGIYDAMNKGIDKAGREYCLFLNSGDWLTNDRVLSKIFQINENNDLLIFQMLKVFETGECKSTDIKKLSLDRLTESSLPHQSTLIKTSLLKKLGGYNLNYKIVADWEFFIRAVLIAHCSYKIFDFPLSCFDMSGISNDPIRRDHLLDERSKVKKDHLTDIIWQAGKDLHNCKNENNTNQTKGFYLISKLKHLLN